MELTAFVLFLAVGMAVLFGLEFALKKWLKIEKVKISETEGKNIDRWGQGIILVVALCFLPFMLSGSPWHMLWFWIIYWIVFSFFQASLQWKYAKESREYILTLVYLPVVITFFLLIAFWGSGIL